jgi:hypothetical protein
MTVEHLGSRRAADDNSKWTPSEMLRATADEVGDDAAQCVVVFRMKSDPDTFDVGFRVCNMHYSQSVGLLEAAKAMMIRILIGTESDD